MSDTIPYRYSVNDADRMKTGLFRYKKKQSKKEKGQMPFPTDRALNDPNKDSIVKKHKYIKKDKMMAISPPRTQPVLSLFPF